MSWTRSLLGALAVCVLLPVGPAGCGTGGAQEQKSQNRGESAAPAGRLLDDTDEGGRHYREVEKKGAPRVAIEVEPDDGGGWDVRLTVRDFRFSPAGTRPRAVPGRGVALLLVDRRPVAVLRGPRHRLAAGYLPHGTHQVTARLCADDDTVWSVDGEPVESTADITASAPGPAPQASGSATVSAEGGGPRTGGRGSPDRGGEAS
ncbi:hypothetical protein ACFV0T_18200 [Streptomyces sp. NPDC059582]|uniref:hypothetical protein n=1 Tax=Streptomyces sp. NPDC059582 TaxID=3346875 RepID=UPI00369E5732